MIRALIAGELVADPQQRTSKAGNAYALARVSVPQGDAGRLFCSVIAFEDAAVARLLQLRAGAAVSLAGTLKIATYQAKDGTVRPSLDLVADEVASTTPRPRKPKESPPHDHGAQSPRAGQPDPFGDLSGAGDVDWMGG